MRSYLFLSPSDFTADDLAAHLEGLEVEALDNEMWCSWFPDSGGGSVETVAGTVFLNYLGDPVRNRTETLSEEQLSAVSQALGGWPKVVLALGISSHHSESDQLASKVIRDLQTRWGGVVFDGDRVTDDLIESIR